MTNEELTAMVELALRDVPDPETGLNIVDMGLVYAVQADAGTGRVEVTITFTTRACPAGVALTAGIERRLGRLPEIRSLEIPVTFEPPWTPERISEVGRTKLGWEP